MSSRYSDSVLNFSSPLDGLDDVEHVLIKLALFPPRFRKPTIRQIICDRFQVVYRLECSLDRNAWAAVTIPQPVPQDLHIIFLETKTRSLFGGSIFDGEPKPGFIAASFYGKDLDNPERHFFGCVKNVVKTVFVGQNLVCHYLKGSCGRKFLYPREFTNLPRNGPLSSSLVQNVGSLR